MKHFDPNPNSYVARIVDNVDGLTVQQCEFIYSLTRDYTVHAACRAIGIPRSQFLNWCDNDQCFKAKMTEYKEMLVDNAEKSLYRLAENGSFGAIRYILECHGADRGWGKETSEPEPMFTPHITMAEGKLLGLVEQKKIANKKIEERRKQKRLERKQQKLKEKENQ